MDAKRVAVYAAAPSQGSSSPPQSPSTSKRRRNQTTPSVVSDTASQLASLSGTQTGSSTLLSLDNLPLSNLHATSNLPGLAYLRLDCPYACWTPDTSGEEFIEIDFVAHLAMVDRTDTPVVACVRAVVLQGSPNGASGVAGFSLFADAGSGWVRHGEQSYHCAAEVRAQHFPLSPPAYCRRLKVLLQESWGAGCALRLGVSFEYATQKTPPPPPQNDLNSDHFRLQEDLLAMLLTGNTMLEVAQRYEKQKESATPCSADVLLEVPGVEVVKGVTQIAVHSAILCARSAYFAECLDRGNGLSSERTVRIDVCRLVAQRNVVVSDPVGTLFSLVAYLYAGVAPKDDLLHAVAVLADVLRIEKLVALCNTLLLDRARTPHSCEQALQDAERYTREDLVAAAVATLTTHWDTLGSTFCWERLSKETILRVIKSVKQAQKGR